MKAAAFAYHRAGDLADALDALHRHGGEARVLAGGQSLVAVLNLRLANPAVVVDIGRLPLGEIAEQAGGLRVGALATHAAIASSPLVRRLFPMLADAAPLIAHPAIRNRGTLGGSIALADPAAEWPACAVALQAQIVLAGRAGERRVPAEAFFRGLYRTACAPDELVTAVEFPARAAEERQCCLELSRRHGDYALVGLALSARMTAGRVAGLRAVFFGVGSAPLLARQAAAAAEDAPWSEAGAAAAAALARDLSPQGDPTTDGPTRLRLAQVLLRRGLDCLAAA